MSLQAILDDVRRGMIPARIYSDPEIFEAEKRHVFAKAWMFMAHESEIPEPGDYVVRRIVDDSFIVTRDETGEIRVLFNMCLHRGMQVCRSEAGNTSHFRCPYHAWTYKNSGELTGVPFHGDAYGGEAGLRRRGVSLLPAPRVAAYDGLIFASLDEDAPDLEDFLGGFRFYVDFYFRQSPQGAEVRGPQRFRVKANWKIGAENFAGDTYHTPHTHASIVEIDLFSAPKAKKRKEGALWFAGSGGGTTYKMSAGDFRENLRGIGYPDEMIDRMTASWPAEHRSMVGDAGFMPSAATTLPNLSFVHNWPIVNAEGLVVPFISIRLWQPVSATETEVYSWFAVDRQAPDWYKGASYKAYLMCFGSSGMFEQDDVENWTSITQMARGQMAERLNLHSRMGLLRDGRTVTEPIDWPAPGRAYTGFGEYNQRELLSQWCDLMEGAIAAEGNGRSARVATLD
ncbi:Rieske 2Fe-2S domain-containing protein [Capillimicrobium parvum]|uniref:Biphenyl 2,3-dioxygenase subunit alpha n=1 Tax=Capillimicrobium parvum TaxID=2884022 RepID=A0A9E7C0A1_9ACTN|nr:Rieske 2Fe-2S domain-containing protein [Capillimicrobium parvum]UGS35322.1 Biphenyl 2,3-dioxygenase subunit alpha [Capillimicrobium parvum]